MANPNGQNGSTQAPAANGAQKAQAIQKVDPKQAAISNFSQYLELRKGVLAKMLPKHMTPERLIKVALMAYSKTPKLRECSIESVWQAVAQAAELGLEPGGVLGHAYLVPYGNTCTLIPGYRGLIELARRSGEIESIEAHVVYEKDKFTLKFGMVQVLEHEPFLDGDAGAPRFFYCVTRLKGGATQLEVMTKSQVDKIRARSKSSGNGPWVSDYEEMGRKTVVKRGCKYIPLSPEKAESLARALEIDNEDVIDVAPVGEAEIKAATRSAAVLAKLQSGDAKAEDAVLDVPDMPDAIEQQAAPAEQAKPAEPAKPEGAVHVSANGKVRITDVAE